MSGTNPRPPLDDELGKILYKNPGSMQTVTLDMVPGMRKLLGSDTSDTVLSQSSQKITYKEVKIRRPEDGSELLLAVFQPLDSKSKEPKPCFYYIHGGGMIMGSPFRGVIQAVEWANSNDGVCVSVEYRLAPEHPDPAPINDCYAGLEWISQNAADLGVDPTRIIIAGGSAGAGLAAGVALMSRDRNGPAIYAQCLIYPMLDDRNLTVSSHQFLDNCLWNRDSNINGWKALLGDRFNTDNVSIYAAPGRAEDLRGLPQTWLDVGTVEVFRDEIVTYASKLWAAGVQAELHVWPGAYHGFDTFAPEAALSKVAKAARSAWIKRILSEQNPSSVVHPEAITEL